MHNTANTTHIQHKHTLHHIHINKHTHILHAYTQNKQRVCWVVPPALSLHTILDLSFYCNYWRSYTVLKQGQKAFSDWENEIIMLKTGWKLGRA